MPEDEAPLRGRGPEPGGSGLIHGGEVGASPKGFNKGLGLPRSGLCGFGSSCGLVGSTFELVGAPYPGLRFQGSLTLG